MKRYIKNIFSIVLCGLVACSALTACKDDDPKGDGTYSIDGVDTENGDAITLNITRLGKGYHANKDGLVVSDCYTYTIRTNGHWQILPKTEDATKWVRFLAMEGDNSSKIYFGVWPNEGFDVREADFSLIIDGKEQPNTFIHIEQDRTIPALSLTNGALYSLPDAGGNVVIDVTTNTGEVDYKIEYDDPADGNWLKFDESASKIASLVFTADANKNEDERKAYVTISSKLRPELSATATIVQNTYLLVLFDSFSYLSFGTSTNIWEGTSAQKAIEQWSADAKSVGWIGMLNGTQTASRTYGRKGYILLGDGGRIGTVATPELAKIGEGTADVNVTFDCVGYVTETGTRDYSDLYIAVWGEGEIEGANENLTVNYKQLEGTKTLKVLHIDVENFPNRPVGIFPGEYDEWDSANAQLKLRVNGANAQTRLIFMGGYWENMRSKKEYDTPDPVINGVTFKRCKQNNRLGIDNVKIVRILK